MLIPIHVPISIPTNTNTDQYQYPPIPILTNTNTHQYQYSPIPIPPLPNVIGIGGIGIVTSLSVGISRTGYQSNQSPNRTRYPFGLVLSPTVLIHLYYRQ